MSGQPAPSSAGRVRSYDVVVVGGGSAGVAAAVGAARAGARVALVEANGFLGGAATASSVMAYCGFFADSADTRLIVGGVGRELLGAIETAGLSVCPVRSSSGNLYVPVNSEAVKLALDRMVRAESSIDAFLHTWFTGAEKVDGRVESIYCRDPEGQFELIGQTFVDTSGDAVLCADAFPSSVRVPSSSRRQVATQVMRIGGVSPGAEIDRESVARAVRTAKLAEMFSSPIRESGFMVRVPGTTQVIAMLADQESDGLTAESLTAAEMNGRELNAAYMGAFQKHLHGFGDSFVVETGPRVGVRQSRSTFGKYSIQSQDLLEAKTYSDQVALGGWPLEIRSQIGHERYVPIPQPGSYGIPIGALALRDADNLWIAGRTIACDDEAYGSLRVMGTAFATGQAAGVAAALSTAADNIDHTVRTRDELARQGAIF